MTASNIAAGPMVVPPVHGGGPLLRPDDPPRALSRLLKELGDARSILAEERRRGGAARGGVDDARTQMVAALSSYTEALAQRRLPVPYALRDELRLLLLVSRKAR